MDKLLLAFLRFACVLAFVVIVLGAYTRLSDAGLGCPDWPGCYGKMLVPDTEEHVEQANAVYPERPLEKASAWKEMVHRYVAGILGLLIFTLCIVMWNRIDSTRVRILWVTLLLLTIFQILLGMWTVTLLLKPVIVMGHLLGGMAIFSLLYWMMLIQQRRLSMPTRTNSGFFKWAILGLVVLAVQISSGGWTSSNYAALACPDFPTCQGVFWPNMDFKEGFVLWHNLDIDYEGGVLHGTARTAIHMTHRIGAIVTFLTILLIAIKAICVDSGQIRLTGVVMLVLLLLQISLGIGNIMMRLPLYIAVAHNGVAALLLLSLLTLLYQSVPISIFRNKRLV